MASPKDDQLCHGELRRQCLYGGNRPRIATTVEEEHRNLQGPQMLTDRRIGEVPLKVLPDLPVDLFVDACRLGTAERLDPIGVSGGLKVREIRGGTDRP